MSIRAMASTDVFYYFGSNFFTHKIKFSNRPEIGCLNLTNGCNWMTDQEQEEWGKLREAVSSDLQRLENAGIPAFKCGKVQLGSFNLSPIEGVWIYRHSVHAAFSNVSVKHFNACAKVRKENFEVGERCKRAHHYLLAPYFKDNRGLLHEYSEYLEISADEDEKKAIHDRIEDLQLCSRKRTHRMKYSCHLCPGTINTDATAFMENDWTVRLFHGLEDFLPSTVLCNYTATMGKEFDALQ